ncbi:L,D-transpeptidase [Plectonema radiosum NIES-515]|uniref:L,D-transpeptidase n=1 Tax=Plectonema radiosum NIES-515 TaxID=2986073 RepID=A0ABT3B325_9CYAN|nr:L,D-transpeptidase [Plectonema radiosum]MCV3215781.1 L,D-transpeptidase [Plectonema radiosum NIES-515]
MGRNESVARIFMWLCFGTAILSLAVHWGMIAGEGQFEQSDSALLRRDATMASSTASASTLSSMPVANSAKVEKNLTREAHLTKNNRLVVDQGKKPKLFLAQIVKPKSANSVASKSQVVVDLSDRRAYVYARDEVIASYPIAVGKKGWETPTGSFQIMHMQHYPAWRHPITGKVFAAGTDSPLGDRWIGFWSDGRNQIGFHGTPDVEVIGTAISHGCLRMRNPDVRMLYKQVGLGTTVIVRQ